MPYIAKVTPMTGPNQGRPSYLRKVGDGYSLVSPEPRHHKRGGLRGDLATFPDASSAESAACAHLASLRERAPDLREHTVTADPFPRGD